MASIRRRKRKDGSTRYRADVRLKGFETQTATFERITDAKKWAQKVEAEIREGRYFKTAESQKHTVTQLVDRYIQDVIPRKGSQGPAQRQQLEWLKEEIGGTTLSNLTPAMITECRDKALRQQTTRGTTRSNATVARYMAAWSHAFTIAVNEWGWLDDSPMRKVKKPSEPRGRDRYLSEDETVNGAIVPGERTRLLRACRASSNPYLYTVVVLAISTGMRFGEIMNLRWTDIDLEKKRITLPHTKNGSRRVVPLEELALELVLEHSKVRPIDTDLVFPGKLRRDKPMDLRRPWLAAVETAGIDDFRFHDLRHTAASYLAMNGASLLEVAHVLGHRTLQMVKRYSHLSEAHTATVVARMNSKIFGD